MTLAKTLEPYVCGGTAATFGSCCIHPIDLAKVSLPFWVFLAFLSVESGRPVFLDLEFRYSFAADHQTVISLKTPCVSLIYSFLYTSFLSPSSKLEFILRIYSDETKRMKNICKAWHTYDYRCECKSMDS